MEGQDPTMSSGYTRSVSQINSVDVAYITPAEDQSIFQQGSIAEFDSSHSKLRTY